MPRSIPMVVMVITQIENRRRVENLRSLYSTVLFAVTILLSTFVSMGYHYIHHADATTTTDDTTDTDLSYEAEANDQPIITDPNLEVKQVVEGLELPTSMAFLGPDDILILEKDNGILHRIVNGKMLPEPLLDVNVANENERGMLGIAVAKSETSTYVFAYFTESIVDGNDDCPTVSRCNPGNEPLGNRLYRYELVDNKLVNPQLLLDLPATPGPGHNGGAIMIGPDNNLYVPIGELLQPGLQKGLSRADGRGGILKVTQNGEAVVGLGGEGILGNTYPLDLYYAYGIRNSFGIDFDPVTGKLWDSENGPKKGDEINLVEPGFNSGWNKVAGMWPRKGDSSSDIVLNPDNLFDFGGKAKYSTPEFSWFNTVGPTAVKFLNSDKLGAQYVNDMFVGDVHNGNLYHFDLNEDRTELVLQEPLVDKVTEDDAENEAIIFGEGFGGITDIEVGPDGYLYVVSIGLGKIFKIVPKVNNNNGEVE